MPAEQTSSTVQIGEWTVHAELNCITRVGETHKLEPRAMRLLLCLAEIPGRVVSVDRLLAEVWAGVVVGPASVYQAVSQLRKTLGDIDPNPTYIATVPRRGYRLVAPVRPTAPPTATEISSPTQQTPPGAPPKSGPRAMWIAAGTVAVLALAAAYFIGNHARLPGHGMAQGTASAGPQATADTSIAVLPFADMSENKDQGYFADGLAEELIDHLGNTPGLKVIARTSSFSFKGKSDDIPTIAAKLNVTNILEGSVRRVGNRLRVTTQLIRADSARPLWSQTFDREFKDVFVIQDEIAAAVVTALKVKLHAGSSAVRGRGTNNPEAYNAYLLGRQLYMQGTVVTWRQAIVAYRRAIELDPRYADAYADLAVSEYYLADQTGDSALWQSATDSAEKAIELDPNLGSGYSVRGNLRYLHNHDWTGAEADLKQALALDPTNSEVLSRYGTLLSYLGRTEEATATIRKAIDQDPLHNAYWQELGIALAESGNHADAYDAFDHALAIRPEDSFAKFHLSRLRLIDGKAEEALAAFKTNTDEEFRGAGVAMAEHTLGDAKASDQALEALIAVGAKDAAYQIAEVYAWRGDKDKAFAWLDRAYRQQDGGLADLKGDLQFATMHTDPRYQTMLRKLNFPL